MFNGEDAEAKAEAQACAAYVLDEIYKLLHPFMPFMTEELWALTAGEGKSRETLLCHAGWPQPDFVDAEAAADINWLIDLVTGIRSVRAEMNVPASAVAPLVVIGANEVTKERLLRHDASIKWRARVETITLADDTPKGSAQFVIGEATACLPLGSLIDVNAEIARLTKEAGKIADESDKIGKKLGNEKFVANAKPEIVEAERERLLELQAAAEKIETAIRRVREAG